PNLTGELAYNYYRMFFYFLNASAFNGKDIVKEAGIAGYDGVSNLQPAGPNIVLSGYTTLGGSTDNRPKANRIRTYQYRSALNWAHGHHNMKFGAQLTHQAHASLNGNGSQGGFTFNGQYTQNPLSAGNSGDAFGDFLLGFPQSVQRSYPQNIFGAAGSSWNFY